MFFGPDLGGNHEKSENFSDEIHLEKKIKQ